MKLLTLAILFAIVECGLAQASWSAQSPATWPTTAPTPAMSPDERLAWARPWLERAAKEAAAVEDPQQKLMMLGELAGVWARAGQVEPFEKIIGDLEAVETKLAPTRYASQMYRFSGSIDLIQMFIKANGKDEARKLIERLKDSKDYYPGILEQLALALAQSGDDEAANTLVEGAQAKTHEAILLAMARGQALRRDEKAAMATAQKLRDPAMVPGVQFALMSAYCEAGDFAAAAQTAAKVLQKEQPTAYSILLHGLFRKHKFAEARKTLGLMSDASGRDRGFLDLAFNQTQAGDVDGARATVKEMSGQSQELAGVILVGRELIKRGDVAEARQLAQNIKDDKVRQRALETLPQILVMGSAEGGDPKRALAHLQEIPEKARNFTLCLSVATAMLKAKDMDGYRQMLQAAQAQADDKNNEGYRAGWYRQLASVLASGGEGSSALKLARLLEKQADRDAALCGAVNGCVQAGDLDGAWDLIAEMGPGKDRASAVIVTARSSVARNKVAGLAQRVESIAPAERCRACTAIADSYIRPAPQD